MRRGGARRQPDATMRGRRIMRVAGEILITFGLVIALFAVYEVYGKASAIEAHQKLLSHELDHTWAQPVTGAATPADPASGRVPRSPASTSRS